MNEKLNRRRFLKTAAVSGVASSLSLATQRLWAAAKPAEDDRLTQFVDVFVGTGGHGHTFPGASLPFGMVQLSPDTGASGWDHCSGYHFDDKSILGFSHTHLSGTGVGDMMDVLLMPATGPVRTDPGDADVPGSGYRSGFSHADEHAEPGYYSVFLKDYGVKAELTATTRAGMHRYSFPADKSSHFVIDLAHGFIDTPDDMPVKNGQTKVIASQLQIAGNDIVMGSRRVSQWAPGRYIYFAMRFSKAFASHGIVSGANNVDPSVREAGGTSLKCVLNYPLDHPETILVKVGLSAVSVEGAMRNLDAEIPTWDFDHVRNAALEAWEHELSRVRIETANIHHKRTFYSGLYHALLAPTIFSDIDGQYRGSDLGVHRLPASQDNYTTYSLWDTYRALHPLYTLIQPERLPDMINSLIRIADQGPAGVPVWPLQAVETGCMIGYHSAVVLAEAHAKGVIGVDYKHAYAQWRRRAINDNYRGLPDYRKMGYIPCDKEEESVSKTLEYAYDDWAVAHLAAAAGATDDQQLLLKRSRDYKNVFDPSSTFMRGKLADGSWADPFDPRGMGHSKKWRDFTESNSWQATFLNQHDVKEYMTLFAASDASPEAGFIAKLDALFNQSSELPADAPPDIAGMVGQYAQGNEPGHHVPYLYAYAGVPYKTQARVRSLLTTMYRDEPDGLAGNEDCGQMSAWYIMSALGLYAVDPVSANYVFGSPLFDRATLRLAGGKRLVILAKDNAPDRVYIQSVSWNEKPYQKSWIRHADLVQGGVLEFTMGTEANHQFGKNAESRPPSYL